ncbi:MAG: glycosyltransferase [Ignavibacteriae bacterium]|nr:glycosyltransferase [Ignavibacteriota bacterium]
MTNNNLTIIIPVHELNGEDDIELLQNAQNSLNNQTNKDFKVLFYINDKVKFKNELDDSLEVNIVKSTEKFSYQTAVNNAVNEIDTDYFSVLEFDDIFHPTYVKNFYDHLNNQKDDVDLYLNIVFEVNNENQMMGLRNEIAWVVNKMQKIGFLDIDSVRQIVGSFSLVGAIYSKEAFLESGGFKFNIEIFFNQEFILRFLNSGYDIYVMPKILVNHMNFRKGSYFDLCDKQYDADEKRGYFNLIHKEYLYKNDREITI